MSERGALTTVELTRLVSEVTAMAPADSDAERIERIRQFEQLKAAVAAAQMTTAVELADSRRRADAEAGIPARRQGVGAAEEIGLARRIAPAQGRRWLGLARILPTELPATFAALAAGRTSEWRALLVARETIFLSRADRADVDAELAPALEAWGDRQVEAEARRAACRRDPAGAAERARNAAGDRRVTVRPAPDTMCRLSALVPAAQGIAAWAALGQHADTLIGLGRQGANPDGKPRTRGQIMADTLIERVTGQATADETPVEINLVMTDRALFGTADEPAIMLGHGPIPTPLARDLALGRDSGSRHDSGSRRDAARWVRRLYLTPDGTQLAAMDTHRRSFTANQSRFIRLRDHDTCRTPWCGAPIRHLDHVEEWARSHHTSVTSGQAYCAACNYTKQAAGWRTITTDNGATVTTVTPTGHRYAGRAPAPPGQSDRRRQAKIIIPVPFPVRVELAAHGP